MKRTFILLLILAFVLLSFSCRKKEGEDTSSSLSPVAGMTAPSSSSLPSVGEKSEKTPLTLSSARSDGVKENEDFSLGLFYRGGEILIKAEFTQTSGTLNFNIDEDEIKKVISRFLFSHPEAGTMTYTLSSSTLTLSYERKTEDEVESLWKDFKDFLNEYNSEKSSLAATSSPDELVIMKAADTVKGTLNGAIYPDKAVITVPSSFSSDDISSFLTYIREKYPEVTDYGTVSAAGSSLTLEYSPSFTNEDASALFSVLVSLVNEYFTPLSGGSSSAAAEKESSSMEEEERTEKEVAAMTETGRKVKSFSLSAVVQNSGDSVYGYVPSAFVKLDYAIKENFSLGFVTGYDFSGFVPVGVSARYYTPFLPALYIEGTFGGKIGTGSNMNYGEWFSIVTLGYEYRLNERWSLFAGADFTYRWGSRTKGLRYGLSVGGRVTF